MARQHNLRLLSLSLSLVIFSHLARSQEHFESPPSPQPEPSSPVPSPSESPAPAPSPSSDPSPSPSPSSDPSPSPSPNSISLPPSSASESPSDSISPAPSGHDLHIDFPALSPSHDIDPKVKEICESTDYPSLCLSAVVPHLQGKNDVPSVLEVAMNLGAKLAEHGLSLVKDHLQKPGNPQDLAAIFDDCRESYETAVDSFGKAKGAFPARDIGTLNSMLSAVITDVGDCEDAFSGIGSVSPISHLADKLTNMTSNCLSIVSLLK